MDDGLQNPHIAKDLTIAVVDGARGVGNGEIIPAGPLRAALEFQLDLVDAILVNGPASGDPASDVLRRLKRGFPAPCSRRSRAAAGDDELACRRRRRRLRGHRQSTSLSRCSKASARGSRWPASFPTTTPSANAMPTRCCAARCGLGRARHHGEGPRAPAGGDGPTRRASRAFARAADPALARRARHGPARCAAGGRAQLARRWRPRPSSAALPDLQGAPQRHSAET